MVIIIGFMALLVNTVSWYGTDAFPPLVNIFWLILLGSLLALLLLVKGIKLKTIAALGFLYVLVTLAASGNEANMVYPAYIALRASGFIVLGGTCFMAIAGIVWYIRKESSMNPRKSTLEIPTCAFCNGTAKNRVCESCGARWCMGCDSWTSTEGERCEKCSFVLPRRT